MFAWINLYRIATGEKLSVWKAMEMGEVRDRLFYRNFLSPHFIVHVFFHVVVNISVLLSGVFSLVRNYCKNE